MRPLLATFAVAWLALAGVASSERSARADDMPTSTTTEYSALEKRAIEQALESRRKDTVDPHPEGKVVESVSYERMDVFGKDDVVPEWFNVFHTRSRVYTISRELLVHPGEKWNQVLIDETTRNLRGLPQLSLAIAVPLVGSAPDKVKLLVITRDVWSLRLQWDIQFIGGRLNYLILQPTEENVAGSHNQPQLLAEYQPLSLTLGTGYKVPRIGSTHIGVSAIGGAMMPIGTMPGRDTSSPEGGYITLDVGQPLYSSLTQWSWDVSGAYRNYVVRRYQNGDLKLFKARLADGSAADVPFQYRQKVSSFSAGATRSLGWALKNDFSFGFAGSFRRYLVEGVDALSPEAVAQFTQKVVPIGEDRLFPFARWHTYRTDYFRTIDVESLQVQEDFRLGHDIYLEVDPVALTGPTDRSSRYLVALSGGAMWTSRIGDGLFRASIEGNVETQADGVIRDAMVDGKVGIVTPRTALGRLIFGGRVIHRPENYLRRTEFLGGDTRLRGYPSSLLFGDNLVATNVEFRSRGFYLWGGALGGALFYDAGDAFSGFGKMQLKHSVGGGLRLLFPFFDELVYRLDVAVPLDTSALPRNAPRVDFIFAIEQAFAFPDLCLNASGLQVARQCP